MAAACTERQGSTARCRSTEPHRREPKSNRQFVGGFFGVFGDLKVLSNSGFFYFSVLFSFDQEIEC